MQTKLDWLDAEVFGDAIFWVQTSDVTNPGGGNVDLTFETAPAADESLFATLDTTFSLASGLYTPRKIFMNTTPGIPLARFLRWKLSGTAAGTWDVTFRVYVTLGEGLRDAFSPLALPNLALWLRSDQAVSLSGTKVTNWNDLSGNGNHVTQSVDASRPVLNRSAFNGRPAIDFSSSKWLENTVSNLGITSGAAYSVLVVAKNGSGALVTITRSLPWSSSLFQGTNTYVYADGVNAGANLTVANTAAQTNTSASHFKSCHRYRGSGTVPQIWLNAAALTPTSAGVQFPHTGTLGFEVGRNSTLSYWNGLIAEVIVTRDSISDADRQKVYAYQQDFFGVV